MSDHLVPLSDSEMPAFVESFFGRQSFAEAMELFKCLFRLRWAVPRDVRQAIHGHLQHMSLERALLVQDRCRNSGIELPVVVETACRFLAAGTDEWSLAKVYEMAMNTLGVSVEEQRLLGQASWLESVDAPDHIDSVLIVQKPWGKAWAGTELVPFLWAIYACHSPETAKLLRQLADSCISISYQVFHFVGSIGKGALDSLEWWPEIDLSRTNYYPELHALDGDRTGTIAARFTEQVKSMSMHDKCMLMKVVLPGGIQRGVELLIGEGGVSVDMMIDPSMSLLMRSSRNGFTDIAFLLLSHGADVNVSTSRGTALHLSVDLASPTLVRALLDRGAKVNVAEPHLGFTPLHSACKWGNVELARILLEFGASQNVKCKGGSFPLQLTPDQYLSEMTSLFKSSL